MAGSPIACRLEPRGFAHFCVKCGASLAIHSIFAYVTTWNLILNIKTFVLCPQMT